MSIDPSGARGVASPNGASPTGVDPKFARRAAIALALVIIPLPLQWYDLGKGALGTIRVLHFTAALMVLIARPGMKLLRAATSQVRPLYAAAMALVIIGTITSLGWKSGVTQFPQGAFYILASIVAAACFIVALQDDAGTRVLARTTPISIGVFLVALLASVRGAHIDVASQFAQALAGDPHALQFGLFRAAFRTVEPEIRASIRHEVFGGLVIVLYIGVVASLRAHYLRRTMAVCALIVFPLVAFSLSRSVLIGVAITGLIGVGRVLLAGRIRILSFMLGLVVLGAVPILLPKVVPLFSAKLTSTSSYNSRLSAIDEATHSNLERLLLGGPKLDHPTQLLVFDVALRGGIVAGLAALVVEIMFLATAWKLIASYYRTGSIATLATIGAMVHLLMRSIAGGGNLMDMVEWIGLSLAIGVLYLQEHVAQPIDTSAPPPKARPPSARRQYTSRPSR